MNRTPLVLSAVLLGGLALPAGAAPAATCFQISDASGDSTFNGAPLSPASLDVLSADVATGTKNLVAVLRLKSLAMEPYQATGSVYTFKFSLGGTDQTLTYAISATGSASSSYSSGETGSTAMSVPAVVDPSAGTITWTVARKAVSGLKPRTKLTNLEAQASSAVHVEDGGSSFSAASVADSGTTTKSYVDGTKTCLKGV
jgi:hypothetical protein